MHSQHLVKQCVDNFLFRTHGVNVSYSVVYKIRLDFYAPAVYTDSE